MLIDGGALGGPICPLDQLTAAGLAADPDAVAVASAAGTLTWTALEAAATTLATRYRALGLAPGDRLASLMPNRVELVVHYLACFKAGLVATPLNYRYTAREIDHALAVSGASAVVAHVERAADLAASGEVPKLPLGVVAFGEQEVGGDAPAAPAMPAAPAIGAAPAVPAAPAIGAAPPVPAAPALGAAHRLEDLLAGEPAPVTLAPPDPSAPAAIFFTSGSTGPAKGVTHSHETLRWMFASTVAALGVAADDVCLPGSSMSHIGAFMFGLASLSVGAPVVVARSVDAHEVLPLLRTWRPTILTMLPAALTAIVRDHDVLPDDFGSLRICRAGADKVSSELLAEFAALAGFQIDEGYGMTEVGLATLNPPAGVIKAGSIGRPVDGFRIAIRDDDHQLVAAGAVGRVWIEARSRMLGYWEAPTATAEVVREGWLDSGDLASADDDGYLWFFGRKKQIIVHDGSNISPLEVESALMEHPDVALAGVVGIHDAVHGENVRAYVTLRPGSPPCTSADLIVFCRERVGYKAPEEVVFLDDMPLNPTGKIDRAGLKALAEDHLHPHLA
ncbi:MAG TPA: class I adenylate-forming enzyme family protein [Acidimicrobiales bacterium]|nr:class I adenylate-forming enzyme family protein [Acidimicrobiales bacterium]